MQEKQMYCIRKTHIYYRKITAKKQKEWKQ